MTPEQQQLKKAISNKLENNEPLTESEEYFYMTQMLNLLPEEAETITAIAENEDDNTIID